MSAQSQRILAPTSTAPPFYSQTHGREDENSKSVLSMSRKEDQSRCSISLCPRNARHWFAAKLASRDLREHPVLWLSNPQLSENRELRMVLYLYD
jgi:hypothetical protein